MFLDCWWTNGLASDCDRVDSHARVSCHVNDYFQPRVPRVSLQITRHYRRQFDSRLLEAEHGLKVRDVFNQRQSPVGYRVHPRDSSSASCLVVSYFLYRHSHPIQLARMETSKLSNAQNFFQSFFSKLAPENLSRRWFHALSFPLSLSLSRYKSRGKGNSTRDGGLGEKGGNRIFMGGTERGRKGL